MSAKPTVKDLGKLIGARIEIARLMKLEIKLKKKLIPALRRKSPLMFCGHIVSAVRYPPEGGRKRGTWNIETTKVKK